MKRFLSLTLYNLLLLVFSCVDFVKWLIAVVSTKLGKTDNNKIKRDWFWGQKFGLLKSGLPAKKKDETRYLIHCASMGEVISAMPLLQRMVQEQPKLTFVITTNTLTGKEQTVKMIAQYQLQDRLFHTYLPIDLPWLVKGLLKKAQADKLIIMEVELWPNLILSANALGKPIAVINGRMTDSSCRGYQRFSWLSQPMISAIDQIFVRNQKDFDNYLELGVSSPKLELAGNIKFDIELPTMETEQHWRNKLNIQNRIVIVAGSTHEGEETNLLTSYAELAKTEPKLLLIIAPRHPHRFSEVTDLVKEFNFNCINSSLNETATEQTQVIVLDQMGVLSEVYAAADMVFIGGSIAKRGGHNPIEASAFAKPVVMGQHIYNNPEIINTLAEGGGLVKINDQAQLQTQLSEWLNDSELRASTGQKGFATIKQNSGVITRLVTAL